MRAAVPALLALLAAAPAAAACRDEAGPQRAADLRRQCDDVGAVCAPSASCRAMLDGIRDGCERLGPDAPNLCGIYVEDDEEDGDD